MTYIKPGLIDRLFRIIRSCKLQYTTNAPRPSYIQYVRRSLVIYPYEISVGHRGSRAPRHTVGRVLVLCEMLTCGSANRTNEHRNEFTLTFSRFTSAGIFNLNSFKTLLYHIHYIAMNKLLV